MTNTPAWLGRPVTLSTLLHLALILPLVLLIFKPGFSSRQKVTLEVIQYPKAAPPSLQVQPAPKKPPPPPKEIPHQVFGLSRKALTTTDSAPDAAAVKAGNTVAKEPDHLKLDDKDSTSLPIPVDEFLISKMPKLKADVRIPYPPSAKQAGIEGPVVMDLLIDETGQVRRATLISGPDESLNRAALAAARGFQFIPGQVDGKSVAVQIRYTYRFVLESR
jgi:protein TonB